jgi:hypothetical protein
MGSNRKLAAGLVIANEKLSIQNKEKREACSQLIIITRTYFSK